MNTNMKTKINNIKLNPLVTLYIIKEVLFFLAIFLPYFYSALSPTLELGVASLVIDIEAVDPFKLLLINTVILLSSGFTVRYALIYLIQDRKKTLFTLVFFLYLILVYFLLGSSIYPDFVLTQDYVLIVGIFFISRMITNWIFNEKEISIIEKFSNLLSNRLIIKKYIIDCIYYILFIIAFLIIIAVVFNIGYIHFTGFQFEDSFFFHFKKILFQYGSMTIFLGCLFSKYTTGKWQLSKSLDNITITRFAFILLTYRIFVYNGLIYEMVPVTLTLAGDTLLSIITVLPGIFKLHSLFDNLFHIISHSSIRIGNFASSHYSHYGYRFSKFTITKKIDYSFLIKRSNLIRGLLFGELKYKLVDSMPTKYSNSSVPNSWYISDTISNQRLSDKLSLIKCKANLDLSKIQEITINKKVFIYIPLKGRCVFISTDSSIIRSINGAFSYNKITSSTSNLNNKVSPSSPSIKQMKLLGASDTEYSLYSGINNTVKNSLDLNVYNTPGNIPVFNKPLPISKSNKPLPLDLEGLPDWYIDFHVGFHLHNFVSRPIIVMPVMESTTSQVMRPRICSVVNLGYTLQKKAIVPEFNISALTSYIEDIESIDQEIYNLTMKNMSNILDVFDSLSKYALKNKLIFCTESDSLCFYPESMQSNIFFHTEKIKVVVYTKGYINSCIRLYLEYRDRDISARGLINILYIELVLNNKIIGKSQFNDLYIGIRNSLLSSYDLENFYLNEYVSHNTDLYIEDHTIAGIFETSTVLIWDEYVQYDLKQEVAIRDLESEEINILSEIITILREDFVSGACTEIRILLRDRDDLKDTFNKILSLWESSIKKIETLDDLEPFEDQLHIMCNYKEKVNLLTIYSYSKDKKFVEMRLLEYVMLRLFHTSKTRPISAVFTTGINNIIERLCKANEGVYLQKQRYTSKIGGVILRRIYFLREQLDFN